MALGALPMSLFRRKTTTSKTFSSSFLSAAAEANDLSNDPTKQSWNISETIMSNNEDDEGEAREEPQFAFRSIEESDRDRIKALHEEWFPVE